MELLQTLNYPIKVIVEDRENDAVIFNQSVQSMDELKKIADNLETFIVKYDEQKQSLKKLIETSFVPF